MIERKKLGLLIEIGGSMRWFVSRHPGAKQWAKTQLIEVDQFVSHLDISQVEMGDFCHWHAPGSFGRASLSAWSALFPFIFKPSA
ncbi:CRISPR-associated protein Csx16 [Vibrio sinaloensis]|nr:CRISPR-associated protein Csx16 [Vibrio sinaloensis]